MIWYIIVGIITLIAISLIVLSIWEVDTTKNYNYDPKGKDRADARDLDEYRTNPGIVKQALKETYPKAWENYIKYYTERGCTDPEDNALKELKYYTLPCRLYYKRKVQAVTYWYTQPIAICGYVVGGLCLISLISMIGPNVGSKCKWAVQVKTAEYETQITKLEKTKQSIITYYSSGVNKAIDNIPAAIIEHNDEVEDLVKRIKADRINLNNPWVSPWVNPACENVDLLRIEATYIDLLA